MQTFIEDSLETPEDAPVRYRAINVMAVLSVVFAVMSILTIFGWAFWLIPIVAITLGVKALKRIRYASEELTGESFARAGIAVAVLMWIAGIYIHHYIQTHSIPSGYKAITFDTLQPNSDQEGEIIPPSAFELEPSDKDPDKRIYISGFIYPGKKSINIKDFILVPSLEHCSFCQKQMKSTEMISVKFTGDLRTDYSSREIRIGGKLRIDREQLLNPLGGLPYQLEADYLQE